MTATSDTRNDRTNSTTPPAENRVQNKRPLAHRVEMRCLGLLYHKDNVALYRSSKQKTLVLYRCIHTLVACQET